MAVGSLMLVLVATVLTDATPITTQVEILQHQVLTLNGVLDNVIKEFGNLRQRHEDLETKFNGISVELTGMRKQEEMMNLRKGRNLGKPLEEQRRSGNGTTFKPTFSLQNHWKGQGPNSANAGTKGDKGDSGLPGPKGVAGLLGPKGDVGLLGPKGDAGLLGPKGGAGLLGPKGDAGLLGRKGDGGLPGPKGDTGHIGMNGNSGPPGLPGSNGRKGDIGRKGEQGLSGVQQKIAFHAKLRNDLGPLTDNEIIIMRSGLVQLGTGYDENTGIFTCQVAGLYVFSVTIVVQRNGMAEVELFRNGHGILDIYAGDKEQHGSGSNMALVELQVNDRIWVQVHDHYYDQGEGLVNHFTTFSGFLLYAQ